MWAWYVGRDLVARAADVPDAAAGNKLASEMLAQPRCLGVVVLVGDAEDARYEKDTLDGRWPRGYPAPRGKHHPDEARPSNPWSPPKPVAPDVGTVTDDDPLGLAMAMAAVPRAAAAAPPGPACEACGAPGYAVDEAGPSARMADGRCGGCGRPVPGATQRELNEAYLASTRRGDSGPVGTPPRRR